MKEELKCNGGEKRRAMKRKRWTRGKEVNMAKMEQRIY